MVAEFICPDGRKPRRVCAMMENNPLSIELSEFRQPLADMARNPAARESGHDYLNIPSKKIENDGTILARDALPLPLICGGMAAKNLIIAVPHGGRCYPEGWFTPANYPRARSLEDTGTDILGLMLARAHRPGLIAQIGRGVVDLNRPEEAIDSQLCPDITQKAPSVYKPYIAAGYGVIPRLSAMREPIYDTPFSQEQTEDILASFHRPYHRILREKLEEMLAENDHILLIDLHSMPDPNRQFQSKKQIARQRGLPDFIFGNLHGATLPASLATAIDEVMHHRIENNAAFSWGWNAPYAGGYTTRFYGLEYNKQTDRRLSVLQIEVNRTLYLDKHNRLDSAALMAIARLLDRLMTRLEDALAR